MPVSEKAQAQADFCKREKIPHFAPRDGRCHSCGKDVYEDWPLETAASRHMTGCPHCCRTYCD